MIAFAKPLLATSTLALHICSLMSISSGQHSMAAYLSCSSRYIGLDHRKWRSQSVSSRLDQPGLACFHSAPSTLQSWHLERCLHIHLLHCYHSSPVYFCMQQVHYWNMVGQGIRRALRTQRMYFGSVPVSSPCKVTRSWFRAAYEPLLEMHR